MKKKRVRGSIIVESALILPLLTFLTLGAMDLMWALDERGNLDHVAVTVAACVHNNGCADPTAAAIKFAHELSMPNADSIQVTSMEPSCATCSTIQMTYTYKAVGPWFKVIPMTTTATAD